MRSVPVGPDLAGIQANLQVINVREAQAAATCSLTGDRASSLKLQVRLCEPSGWFLHSSLSWTSLIHTQSVCPRTRTSTFVLISISSVGKALGSRLMKVYSLWLPPVSSIASRAPAPTKKLLFEFLTRAGLDETKNDSHLLFSGVSLYHLIEFPSSQ